MQVRGTLYRDRPRRFRYERSGDPPPLRLTERDRAIIAAVATYRILRRDQIQTLFFPSPRTCIRSLARLYHHGYLERVRPFVQWGSGDRPTLYVVGREGGNLLSESRNAETSRPFHKVPSRYFLEHSLALNDVRIAFTLAASTQGFALERWISEDEFRTPPGTVEYQTTSGETITRTIRPDAACVLREPHYTSRLLFEIDMATEDNPRFVREKVRPGVAYLRSQAYKRRFGFQSGRWLVVTTSKQRLANMKRATEAAVGKVAAVFYFTTLTQVKPETVLTAPIWYRGGETCPRPLLNTGLNLV